jgi:hypothetical protein
VLNLVTVSDCLLTDAIMIWFWQQLLLLLFTNTVVLAAADHMAMVDYNSSQEMIVADDTNPDAEQKSAPVAAGRANRRRKASQPVRGREAAKAQRNTEVEGELEQEEEEEDDDDGLCWLCGSSVEKGQHGKWRNHSVHKGGCMSAIRCHTAILRKSSDSSMRTADARKLERTPAKWKLNVLRLHPPSSGFRDTNLLQTYSGDLKAFAEDFTESGELLLNKRRFKAHHRFWDAMDSSEASAEFDDRLEDASSDRQDSDGECQVYTKDVSRAVTRSGFRSSNGSTKTNQSQSSMAGTDRGPGRRGGGGSDDINQPPRRGRGRDRDRDRDRRGDGGRRNSSDRRDERRSSFFSCSRRRQRSETPDSHSGRRHPVPEPKPEAAETSQKKHRGSAAHSLSPTGSKQQPLSFSSGRSASAPVSNSSTGSFRRVTKKSKSGVVDLEDEDGEEDDSQNATTISFLASKTKLKKVIDAEISKRSAKGYSMPVLMTTVGKLSEDDKTELRRTGDWDALDKAYQQFLKQLEDMKNQLTDIDQDFDFVGLPRLGQTILHGWTSTKSKGFLSLWRGGRGSFRQDCLCPAGVAARVYC